MIRLFTDVALGTVGHTKGGPAKVAVISSALMGTINGSGRRQRRDHRPVHHPADEALRLPRGVCRRGRGDGEHGRADHAAGDGCRRLHHGRDAEHLLRRGLRRGADPGDSLLRDGVVVGAPGGRQARPGGHAQARMPQRDGRAAPPGPPRRAAGGPGLAAVLRLHAAVLRDRRPGADRRPHPRRQPVAACCRPGRSASCSGSFSGGHVAQSFFEYRDQRHRRR